MTRARKSAAFTLLEVMVAIAILAICLSAVFSAEAGSVRMAHRARKMGLATLLARCKMGEIEEQIAKDGLPAIFDSGSDNCCEDGEIDGFTCKWELEPIVMPDTMFGGEEEEGAEGSVLGASASPGPGQNAPANPSDILTTDPTQMLQGGGSGADTGGMMAMAMQMVYPVLKPAFESQIRRATVTVTWREGSSEHSFDVTQYVVAEQPAALPEGATGQDQNGQPQDTTTPPTTQPGGGTQTR
jgi:general secretion pathway protein I